MMEMTLFSSLYETYLPSGYESALPDLLAPYAREYGLHFETDHFHNVLLRKPGEGRRIAVAVPADINSFTVRYVAREEGIVYLHTEYLGAEGKSPAVGLPLVFPGGEREELLWEEKKHHHIRTKNPEAYEQGTTGAMEKRLTADTLKGTFTGREIGSTAGMYTLLSLADSLADVPGDITLIFSGSNRLRHFPHSGIAHALRRVRPELTIWLETLQAQTDRLLADVGGANYLPGKRTIQMLREYPGDKLEFHTSLLPGVLGQIQESTGTEAIGLAIPVEGEAREEKIGMSQLKEAETLIRYLLSNTQRRGEE